MQKWLLAFSRTDRGVGADRTSARHHSAKRYPPLTRLCLLAADLLSVLEFDANGDYLATGDRGGRVVLLEQIVCSKVRFWPRYHFIMKQSGRHFKLTEVAAALWAGRVQKARRRLRER